MTDRPILAVERLVKRFGTLEAVSDISFAVRRGELFGLLGPNGAGKTTTLKILSTLLAPTAGSATVNGCDVVRERDAVRRSIGITFQDPSLDEQLTALENLRFHAMIYKVPPAERDQRMADALRLVELDDKADVIVKTFSGGMKRRLELARCLMHRPAVLFLDEPTLGLDPQTRRRIWEFLHALRRDHGLTLLLTTHYMDEAEACDRIAIVDHGRIIALDTPAALKARIAQDVVELECATPEALAGELQQAFNLKPTIEDECVLFSVDQGNQFLVTLLPKLATPVRSLNVRRPSLEDVFVQLTGRAIRDEVTDELGFMRTYKRKKR